MSPQAGWILEQEIVPRLKLLVPRNVRQIGSEDADELIQDATLIAAQMLIRTEQRGKSVTPGNIAHYTILHLRSGRRSTGNSNADVLGSATQLSGRSKVNSFDEPVEEDELGDIFTINDVFSTDQEDPGQIAARKIDWEAFLTGLTDREKAVIENILAGRNMSEVARSFGLCPSTIQQCKNRLAARILGYMGPDILQEIRWCPSWQDNLNATREKLACRHDRRN